MSQSQQKVKLKLEIKGSPHYKFEYKGSLNEATKLAIHHLADFRQRVLFDDEYVEKISK